MRHQVGNGVVTWVRMTESGFHVIRRTPRRPVGQHHMVQPGRFLRDERCARPSRQTRRSWLARVLIGTAGSFTWAQTARSTPVQEPASEADEIAAVNAAAK